MGRTNFSSLAGASPAGGGFVWVRFSAMCFVVSRLHGFVPPGNGLFFSLFQASAYRLRPLQPRQSRSSRGSANSSRSAAFARAASRSSVPGSRPHKEARIVAYHIGRFLSTPIFGAESC